MTISLSVQTQKLLEEKLKSGEYGSADEIVYAALEALNQADFYSLDGETLNAIDRAEDQMERGEVHNWTDVREQVRNKFLGK